MRSDKLYLSDILEATKNIQAYIKGVPYTEIGKRRMIVDAVIRNLEVIGEAAKRISKHTKDKHSEIEWRKISALRNILIHEYFGVDLDVLWDIVQNKIPDLKNKIEGLL